MKKIRTFAGLVFFCLTISALNAQTVRQGTADVIVLMDTSGTVLPYYEVINQRVLQSIISKFVRIGDSFHLISFSAVPRYEMSQKINTEADLSRVVSRFMLLYQLGQSADFLSGINFAGHYMTQLPSQQQKILIIISDGIFNPPASSPYRNYTGEQVKTELAKISASIRANGWKVYYVKLPFPSDAVIKDLDGAFYEGRIDADGSIDRSGVDTTADSSRASAGSDAVGQQRNTQNGATASINGQTSNNAARMEDTVAGRTSTTARQADTSAGGSSNTAQEQSGTGGNTYDQNNTNSGMDTAEQTVKEYTDVSQTFTDNLGIEPSHLPEEGGVEFSDTIRQLPQIVFPERLETSGSTAEIPLTVINEASEPAEIQLQSVSLGTAGEIQRQQLDAIIVHIPPAGRKELAIRVSLPDSLRSEGQHRVDIRLDLVQENKIFSQAAAVLLTVKPAFIHSLLRDNLMWVLIAVLAFILILLLFIFILRRRASEPVKYAARRVEQQSDIKQQSSAVQQNDFSREQHSPITASEKKHYPEQLGKKTDSRDTLNAFGSQTVAAAAATKTETAAQFDYLAKERSRTTEGRFALLNSAESHINGRPGLNHSYYSGRISTKPSQSGMTELFVYNQTLIGKRNIHLMKQGTRLSIGGNKNDDFLIFLVPFPANLAQVQYDGNDYRVTILKPEYFPYETSNTIYPCSGRNITAVSKKGYHVTFTFRGYDDPMIKLNTILTSINYTEKV